MECDYCVRDEYFAIESRRGWQPLFAEIREKSANYSIAESKKIQNRDLNRYRDVNPFDHSRIVLRRGTCSYVNASLVKVQAVDRSYILTQGPLPSTVSHFWSMTWEQNCRVIVMLNNTIEKNQVKCHTYWPVGMDQDSSLICDDVQLTVELVEEDHKKNYILRTIKMTDMDNEEVRIVKQYHYTTWPDFGVPATPSDFIQFLQDVRDSGGLGPGTDEDPIGPSIVHCSAGIGRSGTFCIVDTALLQLERGERVNVKELVLEMRRYRMGLIQTAEQLRFSYQSIIEGAQSMDIDLRRTVTAQPDSGDEVESSGNSSSSSYDEDGSAEEVEVDDDVASTGSPFNCQAPNNPFGGGTVQIDEKIAAINDSEEPPPPIPPRGESLFSPDYDRPLPVVPQRPKRPHGEVEPSSASETEEVEVPEGDADTSGTDTERKRRKQTEENIPRTAESENGNVVRHRRQERKERTQQIITNIKEKQKEIEDNDERQARLRSGSKWVGIGVGLVVLVCFGLRYFQGG